MENECPDIYDLLYLLTIPNIGPGRIRRLFQVFKSLEEIKKAPVQKIMRVEGVDTKLAHAIKSGGDHDEATRQKLLLKKLNIRYATIWDKIYPKILKRIPDPPVILFYRGEFKKDYQPAIAVVGTRNPSGYGKWVTEQMTRQLVENGISVVSGMARGVDSRAHHTAIKAGGSTIAVLGCGVDRCYPPENHALYNDIPNHGVVISEYFIGTGPDAVNFPRRNRIISGLSQGTLVIEAGRRSGALITALYALNHNREVFAVPGNINSSKSIGTNDLIKQGAKLVQNIDDILIEIKAHLPLKNKAPKPVPDNLSALEMKVLNSLSGEPLHIDKLVLELAEPPSVILSSLLTLELSGLAQQLAGKMFVRI